MPRTVGARSGLIAISQTPFCPILFRLGTLNRPTDIHTASLWAVGGLRLRPKILEAAYNGSMDIEAVRRKVTQAIRPLKSSDSAAYWGRRTAASDRLPEPYLVYFLLVDLLGFKWFGQGEKVAWTVPVDLEGRTFFVEHRKFGLGVFGSSDGDDDDAAQKIVDLIHEGVRAAEPYFDWRAEQAVINSQVNVRNRNNALFERFQFLLGLYNGKVAEAQANQGKFMGRYHADGGTSWRRLDHQLFREAEWLAVSAIDGFFSWTEHAFVLLAVLAGKCVDAKDVENLAADQWNDKFKTALGLEDPELKRYYDKLLAIRYQFRNFVAHGAFGKSGEAFMFHSGAGAVPVQLPHRAGDYSYRFLRYWESGGKSAVEADQLAIELIKSFVDYMRTGPQAHAWMFLDGGSDLVLQHAQDGTYAVAVKSEENMESFLEYWSVLEDRYANMDF